MKPVWNYVFTVVFQWSDLISNFLFTPYISIGTLAVIFILPANLFSLDLLDFLISAVARLRASV